MKCQSSGVPGVKSCKVVACLGGSYNGQVLENRCHVLERFKKNYGFPGGLVVKDPLAKQEMWIQSLVWGRSPGGGHGNPLQYSFLENPMDRGAWQAAGPLSRQESDTT